MKKLLIVLFLIWFFCGCQVYSVKVDGIEAWSGRFLMFDTKRDLILTITDPNNNRIELDLARSEQYPDSNSVEAIVRGTISGIKYF